MHTLLFLGRVQWIHSLYRDAISLFHPVHEVVGFWEQEFGIQSEEAKSLTYAGGNVDKGHALRAERGRDRHGLSESIECPFEDALGSPGFRGNLQPLNFFFDRFLLHATGSSSGPKGLEKLNADANSFSKARTVAASSTDSRSANLTTSPTTSSVGDASFGAWPRFETVVRCIRCAGVVAREIIAQGVSLANPARVSLLPTSA